MYYKDNEVGFSFELPDEWKRLEHTLPLTFASDKGVIQIQTGVPLQNFSEPAKREEFLKDPGSITLQGKTLGEETNTIIIDNKNRNEGCISTVHDNLHYIITYNNSNDPVIQEAIVKLLAAFQFPSSMEATKVKEEMSQAGPMDKVLSELMKADSPEEARKILSESGMPASIERQSYTIHRVENSKDAKGKKKIIDLDTYTCPKCNNKVSYHDKVCPHCGLKKPAASSAVIGFIIVFIVIFVVYFLLYR